MNTTTAIENLTAALTATRDLYEIRSSVQAVFSANSQATGWTAERPSRGLCQVVAGFVLCDKDRAPRSNFEQPLSALRAMCERLTAGLTADEATDIFMREAVA